jgi:hypothetical protein
MEILEMRAILSTLSTHYRRQDPVGFVLPVSDRPLISTLSCSRGLDTDRRHVGRLGPLSSLVGPPKQKY